MIGHEFNGEAITLPTPNGGKVTFGLGDLTPAPGDPVIPCAVLKVEDAEGTVVADFGMTPGTFGTMLEAIRSMFERKAFGESPL